MRFTNIPDQHIQRFIEADILRWTSTSGFHRTTGPTASSQQDDPKYNVEKRETQARNIRPADNLSSEEDI